MINKINRLNFSAISSKLNENNINNNTKIPEINNKANFQSLINDFKTSYRTNRYWGNSGERYVSLPEKSMTIMEQLEKPILDNIDYNIFGSRPQLSITFTKSNIKSGDFYCLTVINDTVIAGSGSSEKGIYYSEDKGKTWKESNITSGEFWCLTVVGNTVIAGSDSDKGLYYSEDNGHTWNQSNITTGYFRCLTVIGSTVIAGEIYTNAARGLLYSEDNGHTWNQSNITSGKFISLMVIGSTVIAGSADKGLYYSEDNGHTWQLSNITSSSFYCLTVIGSTVIAGSWSNKGLYYSEDNGHTWQLSNITSGDFLCLTVIGSTVIAGSYSDKGLYYSDTFDLPKLYKAISYEENTIDKFKRKIQLDSFETILDEQDLPTLESELTTPLKYYNGGLFEINGETYIVGKDITDFVYVNGYYYALIPSGKVIYKLNKNKILVSKITHPDWNDDSKVSFVKLLDINNSLFILTMELNESSNYDFVIYTDKETVKVYPELYNDNANKLSIITDNSKI